MSDNAFLKVPDAAVAQVTSENYESYRWNGLILGAADQSDTIAGFAAQLAEAIAQRDAAIAERDARPTSEQLAAVVAERDARPTQEAYNTVIADRDSKIENINELQSIVTTKDATIEELEKRPTAEQLSTAIAERDARPTQEAYNTVIADRDSKIENINELQSIVTTKDATIEELEKRPTAEQLSTAIAERDARPTQEAYDTVVGERDARPTTDELQDARNGSVVINSSNGEAIISFNIEESEDLKTWQATGEKITKTIQLKDGKKFYRFALDK